MRGDRQGGWRESLVGRVLSEENSIPKTHMMANSIYNSSSRGSCTLVLAFVSDMHACGTQTDTYI